MKQFKKYLRWTWITLILITVTFFLIYPDSFTAESLKTLLHDNSSLILIVFIALSCIRALFFLPSTLFVLMGTVLYPDDPVFVLIVSMIGILIGATLVYKAAAILTPEESNRQKEESLRRKRERGARLRAKKREIADQERAKKLQEREEEGQRKREELKKQMEKEQEENAKKAAEAYIAADTLC